MFGHFMFSKKKKKKENKAKTTQFTYSFLKIKKE